MGQAIITKLEVTNEPTNRIFNLNQKLNLDGLVVKATKSDDTVLENYKDYKATPENGSTLTEWGRNTITLSADEATTTTDVLVITEEVKFSQCTWEILADWAYFVEVGVIDTETFAYHFLKDDGSTHFSNINEFIGLEKTININGLGHTVRIIDVQHDTIDSDLVEENTKALFTFQFANKISKSNGGYLSTKWDTENTKIDYINSQIRYNLNKTGSSTKQINWINDEKETRSLFEMLPAEFDNYIWPVKKQAAVRIDGQMSIKEYTDRLFLTTPTEYNQKGIYYMEDEGTPYDWWTKHGELTDRQIEDVAKTVLGNGISYFTPSAIKSEKNNNVCSVKNNVIEEKDAFGAFDPTLAEQAIVPCFCI